MSIVKKIKFFFNRKKCYRVMRAPVMAQSATCCTGYDPECPTACSINQTPCFAFVSYPCIDPGLCASGYSQS